MLLLSEMLAVICIFLFFQLIQGTPLEQLYEEDTRPLCPCGNDGSSVDTRIVGGQSVSRNLFPYASGLVFRMTYGDLLFNQPYCGGTLITDRHVLTAAHCLKDRSPSQIAVDVGDYSLRDGSDGEVIPVKRLTQFPEYKPTAFHTDIGIVELKEPVQFQLGIRTAWLLNPDFNLKPGTTVFVYGWGRTNYSGSHPDILQAVDLPVVDNKRCQGKFVSTIEPSMICAGGVEGKDACIGDSGSGLVVQLDNKFVLCGIVSFGRRCALPHVPGVYTRVSSYLNWILKETQTAGCKPCIYGEN